MTPENQRIAIAKACGWKPVNCRNCTPLPCSCDTDKPYPNTPPNYPNDLNAMHEAEKVLTLSGDWEDYATYLAEFSHSVYRDYSLIHATAAQRAEAFLKTLGLWEKEKLRDEAGV